MWPHPLIGVRGRSPLSVAVDVVMDVVGVRGDKLWRSLALAPTVSPRGNEKLRDALFGRLEHRLARWPPEQVELELSVTERDTKSQRTVPECWISGMPKLVATSTEVDIDRTVAVVRK
jgi:hypothetical protein